MVRLDAPSLLQLQFQDIWIIIPNIDDAKVVQPLAKRKLVLVQINSPSLKKFRAMLSEEYPIIDVDSEKEAVQLVDKQHDNISAVLFNVELCKQSGFWLQKVLNEDKRFVGIPNIGISTVADSEDYKLCIAAGANEYFEVRTELNTWNSSSVRSLMATVKLAGLSHLSIT